MSNGIPGNKYQQAKAEATLVLRDMAKKGKPISYGDLSGRISAIDFDPHGPNFHHLLGDISIEEHKAGRGLLSVLVVHATGDQMPGAGFFELGETLGLDTSDRVKFWTDQFRKVCGL
tara:strand:- start:745 stop:1095 length:351 start_codon:yes stop_codon:yes gene_type:complete